MNLTATPTSIQAIEPWRDRYKQEMAAQIVHDSLHNRTGWSQPMLLEVDREAAGYGSVLVAGPWEGTRTAFEFYLGPEHRSKVIDLFALFLRASDATAILAQTNDELLTTMLHLWCRHPQSEKIVFKAGPATTHPASGSRLRQISDAERSSIFEHHREPIGDWALEFKHQIVATGAVALHYNRPYGDIFMEVAEPFRRQGFGAYFVQELKRIAFEQGNVPCARCDTNDVASRRTIQKAGFVPCAHILSGVISPTS